MSVVRDPPTVDFLFCFAICVWIVVSLFLPLFPVESIASLSLSLSLYIYIYICFMSTIFSPRGPLAVSPFNGNSGYVLGIFCTCVQGIIVRHCV